ncbi:MAG: cytochrome c oxidase subunit 3 [Actinobacteria bacterium]|nr:cytochrome c oxidase subunit 3 [Actinomycetota bacterium]
MIGYAIVAWRLSSQRTVTDPMSETGESVVAPIDLPALPWLLAVSTVVILASSGTIQFAKSSIRAGRQGPLKWGLALTLLLGGAFLVLQTVCWIEWYDAAVKPLMEQTAAASDSGDVVPSADARFARFAVAGFLVLSGLHAAHVVGGLIPLAFTLARALRGRYSRAAHSGVSHVGAYWHFLDVVWLILYAALWVGT